MKCFKKELIFLVYLTGFIYGSNGCSVDGHNNWLVPITTTILDTLRGTVTERTTTDIIGIGTVTHAVGLNSGPYVDVSFVDSRVVITTNDAYALYEEYETSMSMSLTVTFQCAGGTTSNGLVFVISVTDTNNNAPQFRPTDNFIFTIAPPLPPGFEITGCFNDITVRDIDLTTQRIDFSIEDNPFFEIEYDAASSTDPKEFKAMLRTVSFIRNVPEPITFTISATDVDLTGDDPITTSTTVTIIGDSEFEFPEEPVFTEAFYLAEYAENEDRLILSEVISLRNGYHELVQFSLEGEHRSYFVLDQTGNDISIRVASPLPAAILTENKIFLIVRAEREYTSGDTATLIVKLPEEIPLQFERAYYVGTIEDNILQVPDIILTQGYDSSSLSASLSNELSTYFDVAVEGNRVTLSMTVLPQAIIYGNSFINLELTVSNQQTSATAIVSLEIIKDDITTPILSQSLYTGSYNPDTGLILEDILLIQGYDETVTMTLEGEHVNLFQVEQVGAVLTVTASIPDTFNEPQIHLIAIARKPRTVGASAAVLINLPANAVSRTLRFSQDYFTGSIENDSLTLEDMTLEGYSPDVTYSFTGDYTDYFQLTNQAGVFTLQLLNELPSDITEAHDKLVFTISAEIEPTRAHATVILDIIKNAVPDLRLTFEDNYYTGTFSEESGLSVDSVIRLSEGIGTLEATVSYSLEGVQSQWFEIVQTGDSVSLTVTSPIPAAVIESNQQLIFVIKAESPGFTEAIATVVISIISDTNTMSVLGFNRISYTGSIENNLVNLQPITVIEGYTDAVTFALYGDLAEYFRISPQGSEVNVVLDTSIPEQLIPANKIVILEIRASSPQALTAYATIVLEVIVDEEIQLAFESAFYTGSYDETSGLTLQTPIVLTEGYDNSIQFELQGEHSQWFGITQNQNSISLVLSSAIPVAVLTNNHQLVFVIAAHRTGSVSAQATVVIALLDETTENPNNLGFDRVTYIGSIQNNVATLQPITVSEGYTSDVTFGLYGDLATYYSLSTQGAVVNVLLQSPIPEQLIPTNGIIVLEIRASSPQALTAHATIVFEVIVEDDVSPDIQLAFDSAFYTGSYDGTSGLVMGAPIVLTEGYDDTVQFELQGEHSQWFSFVQSQNSISLVLTSGIPAAVLSNNHQLVFIIAAHRTGSVSTKATIVIALLDETTENPNNLGFDRVTYIGSIQNNVATLQPITVSEGYTSDVTFGLYGDLATYFSLSTQGAVVNVLLQSPIPEQLIPTNGIIVLEIRVSSPQAVTAYATIVFEVIVENNVPTAINIAFDSAFYTGSYDGTSGLVMETPVILTEGYDDTVQFELQGEHSQWFSFVQNQNSISLVLSSAIPVAVLTNNHQLVFFIAAHREGAISAQATIVIALLDETTENPNNLGFDRVTYIGSIQNNVATLQPITVSEGYTSDVTFGLYGDLATYFSLSTQGAVVNVLLQSPIPEQLIPTNGIIVLEIRASSPQALTAYATIVFEVIIEDDVSPDIQLAFDSAFYTGSYDGTSGLVMGAPIVLTEGYDNTVQFELQGEHSQWFSFVQNQNSISLVLSSAIPAAVLTNNHQLVFFIAAHREGAISAQATIVIALLDETPENPNNLGFDRVTYIGSIQNNVATLQPITVSEGYTSDVTFGLYGDLATYFSLSTQGAVINVLLQSPIPEQLIPTNRIIVLEIRASSPQALTAYATIVFEVIIEDDVSPDIQLAFDSAFYAGSYDGTSGLVMGAAIVLTEGYDDTVQFELEGDHSQWFSFVQNQNSISLVLTSGIPAAVLTNNHQLVFVIAAHRPGSLSTQATIVIALLGETTENPNNLGFDRVTYIGSIQNNVATLQPITVSEGYTSDVTFGLYGDLATYFSLSTQGAVVNVLLQSPIPEQLIPTNGIIVLEIRASSPQDLTAYATIVFEVIVEDNVPTEINLAFDSAFYTGSYDGTSGLVMGAAIVLTEGYDDTVQFELEGEHSQWFSFVQDQNSISLVLTSGIPAAVLTNNHQLVFVIAAHRPGSLSTQATIVIALLDETTENPNNLGFDRVTYIGSIQNNVATLQPITVSEGFTSDVTFGLYGDLATYFSLSTQGAVVNVLLQSPIPEQLMPTNGIIVLEIRASSPQALTAYATIVFEVIVEDDVSPDIQLAFDSAYYTGSYDGTSGLVMGAPIVLTEGYDDTVQFELQGEHSQWFSFVESQNSVSLVLTSGIPAAVLTNNHQLVFVIAAHRTGSVSTQATIVIALLDETTENPNNLGFDRVTYIGSIQNNVATLQPITVSEGYTSDVTFGLYGDLVTYFSLSTQGAVVNLLLQSPIPEQLIPTNGIIVLEIRASSPQALIAYATIVFEVIVEDDVTTEINLAFDSAFYTGSYDGTSGLVMEAPVVLTEGYDDTVQFELQGEHSQWFSFVQNQNSISLVLSSAIPAAVLTNNHQLVFFIAAHREGAISAQATIVIALLDETTENPNNLGFDRVTYIGSIQNNVATLQPITVSEGYTSDVTFGLYGDLATYFSLSTQGAVVNVLLQSPIPEQLIPTNGIIVLEIRASSPQALTAYATIVFEVIVEDDVSPDIQLAFDSAFYTGSYDGTSGLVMGAPIVLTEGYDDTVQFELQGEHSQWFSFVESQNSVSLVLTSGIPAAVLTNNHQLVFVIAAHRTGSVSTQATLVIALLDETTENPNNLGFDRVTYIGSIQNNVATLLPITVSEGYTSDVTFGLYGDLATYFSLSTQGAVVNLLLQSPIPEQLIPTNGIIVLEIRASSPQALIAYATIVFEVIVEDDVTTEINLAFDSAFYTGSYDGTSGLVMEAPVVLTEGYDDTVQFELQGEHSQWFSFVQNQNSISLVLSSAIPAAVLTNNHQLVFFIAAHREGAISAQATIVIALLDETTENPNNLGFDRVTYIGSIQNNVATLQPITVSEGYTSDVTFGLYGDLATYFSLSTQGAVVNVLLQSPIPEQLIPTNGIIVLEIRASSPQALTAYATIVFEVIVEDDVSPDIQLAFDSAFYTGSYDGTSGLVMGAPIVLTEGYDDTVQFELQGEHSQWFSFVESQNSVSLVLTSGIPAAVLTNNHQLVFVIAAHRTGSVSTQATLVIALLDETTENPNNLGFDRVTYIGSIQDNVATLQPITVSEGYTSDVTFGLYGDLATYFSLSTQGAVVNVLLQSPIPEQLIPTNGIIVLEIRASSPQAVTAYATIVFEVIVEDDVPTEINLAFDSAFYTGSYDSTSGLVMETLIVITQGYDDSVQFELQGEHSQWFRITQNGNSISLIEMSAIPGTVVANNHNLLFVVAAHRTGFVSAYAAIVISLPDSQTGSDGVWFEKVLYNGIIQLGTVLHESILISGYNDGIDVEIVGEYSQLFTAQVTTGVLTIQPSGSLTLPADVTSVVLELHASGARAVLILNVIQGDAPIVPSVTFSSDTYVVRVDIHQTGLAGRVEATADTGETLTYSLDLNNAHLQTRLSINNEGELHLSAPVDSGVYTFGVIATTVITQATARATVYLTVDAVTVCEDDIVVPPLIILDRDEEEPHNNLVVLDPVQHQGCRFNLNNRWPVDQTWLYVDGNGLHTTSIDREDPTIAFMALSQVQVELILECDSDNLSRTKRSLRTDWLGPYDYGTNKWILTETIPFNSRRSLVNLIVNDINDNVPIFVGKELEPIAVGYPNAEVEEVILPRSLVELQANDADVGENAALIYTSSETELAVASKTGFVHVRNGAQLQNNQLLTVNAIDRNGEGLTGTIQLVVKLLDLDNIVVVTVRDAFLDDEATILAELSDAVGYDVRALRSTVVSDDIDEPDVSRKKRDTNMSGVALQLYVYGLVDREPVEVSRLMTDINSAIVSVVSTVSLEDHLADSVVSVFERDTGLLAATIVLSILLFLLMVAVIVWFFLRWRANRNYDQFSDENSLASRNESLSEPPKSPEIPKPRLNIEELKKSERRLQEMLNTPIEQVTVEPSASKKEPVVESILDLSIPEAVPYNNMPIVIQSIDKLKDAEDTDDDEFGERKEARRKSVVTFNENVEKIIHVEDVPDDESTSTSDFEVYRL